MNLLIDLVSAGAPYNGAVVTRNTSTRPAVVRIITATEGNGVVVGQADRVTVHLLIKDENGRIVVDTRRRGVPMRFATLDAGMTGITLLQGAKEGEVRVVSGPPSALFERSHLRTLGINCSLITVEAEMLRVEKGKGVRPRPTGPLPPGTGG